MTTILILVYLTFVVTPPVLALAGLAARKRRFLVAAAVLSLPVTAYMLAAESWWFVAVPILLAASTFLLLRSYRMSWVAGLPGCLAFFVLVGIALNSAGTVTNSYREDLSHELNVDNF